jgi:hypothetical protein
VTLEEHYTQLVFQLLDGNAERGLRDKAGLGGAAKMALAGKGDKVAQIVQGHLSIYPVFPLSPKGAREFWLRAYSIA